MTKYSDTIAFYQKMNANCPLSEKNGTGPGSCGGNTKDGASEVKPTAEKKPETSSEPKQIEGAKFESNNVTAAGIEKDGTTYVLVQDKKTKKTRTFSIKDPSKAKFYAMKASQGANLTGYGDSVTEVTPSEQKQNANCPLAEKTGTGPGSCGGKTTEDKAGETKPAASSEQKPTSDNKPKNDSLSIGIIEEMDDKTIGAQIFDHYSKLGNIKRDAEAGKPVNKDNLRRLEWESKKRGSRAGRGARMPSSGSRSGGFHAFGGGKTI